MAEETKNINQEPKGWEDIFVHQDMPLSMIINFINGLNQRLVHVENNMKMADPNDPSKEITYSEFYKIQAKKEQEEALKQATNTSADTTNTPKGE